MTTPHEEQPQTEVPATPQVTTAPPRVRWRFGNVPSRLGRARTSTVVLVVLFVAVFVLWVYVRPETVTATTGTTGHVPGPVAPATTSAAPTTSEAPTTSAPTTTPPSETASEPSTPTDETTSGARTTTPGSSSSTSTSRAATTSVGVPSTPVPVPTG